MIQCRTQYEHTCTVLVLGCTLGTKPMAEVPMMRKLTPPHLTSRKRASNWSTVAMCIVGQERGSYREIASNLARTVLDIVPAARRHVFRIVPSNHGHFPREPLPNARREVKCDDLRREEANCSVRTLVSKHVSAQFHFAQVDGPLPLQSCSCIHVGEFRFLTTHLA